MQKFIDKTAPIHSPIIAALILGLMLLAGCAASLPTRPQPYEDYLNDRQLGLPDPDGFQHCRHYGCTTRSDVSLAPHEWARITAPFENVRTAQQERNAIARAIGIMERIVGPKTNTAHDRPGTFEKTGEGQLDCVDESINTTITLAMLEQKKLLKFHAVSTPAHRVPTTTIGRGIFWPHQTAVIFEKKTNTAYAVDSWFRENGMDADIVTLWEWVKGWTPDIEMTGN